MSIFDKPVHEDMVLLTRLINRLDDTALADAGIDKIMEREGIHPGSLGHLASQRAMRALGITTMGEIQRQMQEFVRLASVYHEAFVMGMWFEQEQRT